MNDDVRLRAQTPGMRVSKRGGVRYVADRVVADEGVVAASKPNPASIPRSVRACSRKTSNNNNNNTHYPTN